MNEESKVTKILYNQVSLVIAIVGFTVGAVSYLTGPTRDNDVAYQLQDQRISAQRTTIDELTKTQQNDMKEIKNEMAGFRTEVQALTNTVVKLSTIIEERIPKL